MANLKKGYQPKGKLGSGQRSAAIKGNVASEYIKKGYSAAKAKQIGGAVAGMAGAKKYGQKKMTAMAQSSKK
jgi:hypothetical protein